jgi:hypothetical protein
MRISTTSAANDMKQILSLETGKFFRNFNPSKSVYFNVKIYTENMAYNEDFSIVKKKQWIHQFLNITCGKPACKTRASSPHLQS